MRPVYIDGIGIISRCTKSLEDLVGIINGDVIRYESGKLEFTSNIPAAKLRRCSRYNKLAAAAADHARIDADISDDIDKYRVGTIFSTGYGAVENNIAFSDQVVKGDPQKCSPTIFSGTVPNSCVGQVCILNGYKGVSTILMGGDPLEYSALLLNNKKADVIFVGSVEEYSEELFKSISSYEAAQGCEISEGTAIMTLRAEKNESSYCEVADFASVSLPEYPYVHKLDESCVDIISEAVSRFSSSAPDVIFTSENGTYFDNIERCALEKVFADNLVYAVPKKLFGETLGSGYMLSTALASVVLKQKKLPTALGIKENVSSILVTGIDTVGNYCCVLLKAV